MTPREELEQLRTLDNPPQRNDHRLFQGLPSEKKAEFLDIKRSQPNAKFFDIGNSIKVIDSVNAAPITNIAKSSEQQNNGLTPRQELEELRSLDAAPMPGQPEGGVDDSFFGAGVIEPAMAIGSGLASTAVAGFGGIGETVRGRGHEQATDTIKSIQEAGTYQPRTPEGKAGLKTLGELIEKGIDLANLPLSVQGAFTDLIFGRGTEQAGQTIKDIQDKGFGKTYGDRTLDATGSPLAATAVEMAPDIALAAIGLKGMGSAAKVAKTTAKASKDVVTGLIKHQTPAKQRIAKLITEGSDDISTAKFKLKQPGALPAPKGTPLLEGPKGSIKPPNQIEKFFDTKGAKVTTDKVAKAAVKQGWREESVATIKASSKADKIIFNKMLNNLEEGQKSARFKARNRPSDILGDRVAQRVNIIRKTNKAAGKELDVVANSLKGKPVDIKRALDNFDKKLNELGVQIVEKKGKLVPDFEFSILPAGDRGPLKEVIRQMDIARRMGNPDGFAAHRMKRIINNNVTFGKTKTGISRDAENLLKKFSHDIDKALDTTFPAYNDVNITYAETIKVLNKFQDAVGKKLDLTGPNVDKALGVKMRSITSNNLTRGNLLTVADDLERVATKYGGAYSDDITNQIIMVNEIEHKFGSIADTAFQSQITQGINQAAQAAVSPKATAVEMAAKGIEKARFINNENALKAMRNLLKQESSIDDLVTKYAKP